MNSQRGKASTYASRQNKSQKSRQASKSIKDASTNSVTLNIKPDRRPYNKGRVNKQNLINVPQSTGSLKLSSGNRSGTSRKAQVIEEDEYIAEVSGSVGFATTTYPINPGQSATFPWAFKIAALYEKYRFEYLEFYYRREVSEFATNGQSGKVMLSCDYDSSDTAPTTKQQVEDTVPHADGMPCTERISLSLNTREMSRQDSFYVRPGLQPANTDIKTYDSGNLYVSTYGCTNTTVVGELRVRYRCHLMVPVLESSVLSAIPGSTATFDVKSVAAGTTNTANLMFSSNPLSNIGILGIVNTAGIFTLPSGNYLIEVFSTENNSAGDISGSPFITLSNTTTATGSSYFVSTASHAVNGTLAASVASTSVSILWTTSSLGTTFSSWITDIYSGGSTLDSYYMRITAL
jgi:hypothetical protein